MLLVCALPGWLALHPAIAISRQAAITTFSPELLDRLCTVLFRHMNYKPHLPVATATKLATTSSEVTDLGGRNLHLARMALRDCSVYAQALNEHAVRNIVGD
jgi:hypothetical protein